MTSEFVDTRRVELLYQNQDRLRLRACSLLSAKVIGRDPIDVALDELHSSADSVIDIGCGLGGSTAKLARRLRPRRLTAFDRSEAMIRATVARTASVVATVGDFHQLPFPECTFDVALAAFCLYHTMHPETVCAEIGRVLNPHGTALIVTKGRESYRELDHVLSAAGFPPDGETSLYETFCAENCAEITARKLQVRSVIIEKHVFRFTAPDDLVAYVRTSPRWAKSVARATEKQMTTALTAQWPEQGAIATSDVAVIVAGR